MKLEPTSPQHIEMLAKDLHAADRDACATWNKAPEHVREGRRVQARALMAIYRLLRD